jgi:hypothetical protein
MPDEFTFKFLVNQNARFNMGPVDGVFNHRLSSYECSFNGMSISIKNQDSSILNIIFNNQYLGTYANDVVVHKNGITEDTTVTCQYYVYTSSESGPNYSPSSTKVFAYYAYTDEQGQPQSENLRVTHTYYQYADVYLLAQPYPYPKTYPNTTMVRQS